jgi:hypothetical protein
MENESEVLDTQNNQEGESETTITDEGKTLTPEEIADLKHKAGVSSQNFERAKKAEADKKALEAELAKLKQSKPQEGLTAEDVLSLTTSGVSHKEDVELAKTWAKNSGKPLGEILEDKVFKTVLEVQREERKTADTSQVKSGAKVSSKTTGEELLRRAEKGEFPAEEDIDRMLDAKFEARKQALKR